MKKGIALMVRYFLRNDQLARRRYRIKLSDALCRKNDIQAMKKDVSKMTKYEAIRHRLYLKKRIESNKAILQIMKIEKRSVAGDPVATAQIEHEIRIHIRHEIPRCVAFLQAFIQPNNIPVEKNQDGLIMSRIKGLHYLIFGRLKTRRRIA